MKKILLLGLFMIITSSSHAAIVKSYDIKAGCDLYRVVNAETKFKKKSNEEVIYKKEVYGMTFEDLEIDFESREARVQVMINVVMGVNTKLNYSKSTISSENARFTQLINQLNRKLFLLEKVCINHENKIIYADQFKNE